MSMQRRLTAILAADVVGYSRLKLLSLKVRRGFRVAAISFAGAEEELLSSSQKSDRRFLDLYPDGLGPGCSTG